MHVQPALLQLPCVVQTPSCGWRVLGRWPRRSSDTCCSNTGPCSHTVWLHSGLPLSDTPSCQILIGIGLDSNLYGLHVNRNVLTQRNRRATLCAAVVLAVQSYLRADAELVLRLVADLWPDARLGDQVHALTMTTVVATWNERDHHSWIHWCEWFMWLKTDPPASNQLEDQYGKKSSSCCTWRLFHQHFNPSCI